MEYCNDLISKLNLDCGCCSSCHEDEQAGYDLIEQEYEGITYYICCEVSNYFDSIQGEKV